ncbi:ER degradation-enhancing alpha-mannosidase-like 2 [Habropoda laboriosa]|uniref:alpha-1,2-Mannosidase n=1 Tax=Habropoda laboriosa TaxID=597456 RepID=A0A0L7R2G5_9HYME|nr:ER degradation-enhancing alpha-mannosidase-like 2 [Habropoda laboriosa]
MFLRKIWLYFGFLSWVNGLREYEKKDLIALREEVRSMFDHAYSSYLTYAYPYDELRSLSCDGFDTWGSFSLTLIDALDTLAVMGNFSEFRRVTEIISARANFEANINVSVFETNIRVVGGLLSAHLLSHKAGIDLEPGWPCNGPLLRETSITCTAGIGTFLLEFGTLSRLTGDPLYEEVAMNAIKALHYYKSNIGLVGNHVDVLTGHWTAQDSGIGAGVDSYFEYLAKGTLLFQDPLLATIFHEHKAAIEKYIRQEDWHLWVSMTKGQVTLPVFQSLDAYWPGVLSLFGEIGDAMKSLHNYHSVWKQFGFTPEFYNIPQAEACPNREGYPLRPELIESVMYLYRATGDPYLIQVGIDILKSLQHSAKTTCGYATINDVRDHRKADRMESFFLAETTKYLYLLFDPDNFIHNSGQKGEVIETQWGQCIVDAGGYIFNTEAHPIDPGALYCCHRSQNLFSDQKARLWKFIPVNDLKEKNNIEYNMLHQKDVKNKDDDKQPIEIVKLSEIRHTFTNDTENSSTKNSINHVPSISDAVHETITIEKEDKVNVNNPDPESLEVQVVAPPSGIYKADDSENIDTYETYPTPDGHYSTPAIKNKTESFIKQSNTKTRFEPQILLENIRKKNLYPTNDSARLNYQLLSCQSQSFLQRISMIGEFF